MLSIPLSSIATTSLLSYHSNLIGLKWPCPYLGHFPNIVTEEDNFLWIIILDLTIVDSLSMHITSLTVSWWADYTLFLKLLKKNTFSYLLVWYLSLFLFFLFFFHNVILMLPTNLPFLSPKDTFIESPPEFWLGPKKAKLLLEAG